MPQNSKFDLAALLKPVSCAQFFDEYWEEKPLLVRRNDRDYYAALLTLDEIDPLITVLPSDMVTLANSDDPVDIAEFARADGTLDRRTVTPVRFVPMTGEARTRPAP